MVIGDVSSGRMELLSAEKGWCDMRERFDARVEAVVTINKYASGPAKGLAYLFQQCFLGLASL